MRVKQLIIYTLCLLYLIPSCVRKKETPIPGWVKDAEAIKISKPDYIADVGVSGVSFDEASEKVSEQLIAKVNNSVLEFLSMVSIDLTDPIVLQIKDGLRAKLEQLPKHFKGLVEIRSRYYDKANKKYYCLGILAREKVYKQIRSLCNEYYNPDFIFQNLKETPKGIYRIKVQSLFSNQILNILSKNGLTADNIRWYAEIVGYTSKVDESSIGSLTGPLYTAKVSYEIIIKGKDGTVIGQIQSNTARGVANSRSKAINKATSQLSIDMSVLNQYIPQIKQTIENYIKNEITTLLQQPAIPEFSLIQRALDVRNYTEAEDYLANARITSKDFGQAITLYLKIQAEKEQEKPHTFSFGRIKDFIKAVLGPVFQLFRKILKI